MSGKNLKLSYAAVHRRASKQIKLAQEHGDFDNLISHLKNRVSDENSPQKLCLSHSLNNVSSSESSDVENNFLNSADEPNDISFMSCIESESDENLTSNILSSSFGFTTDPTKEETLGQKLRIWAIENKITLSSLSNLLNVLHEYHPDLPLDGRTLLKTSRKCEIVNFDSGEFCYYGIAKYLKSINLKVTCPENTIKLRVNVDGLPLYKSSGTQFWPILGLIISEFKLSPFLIACYCGSGKPVSLDYFFKDFVSEVKNLSESGFHQNSEYFGFKIDQFNCDAPARAFIKNIKNHNSYYGCEKCVQKGTVVDGHVRYLEMSSPKRSDEHFTSFLQKEHHTGLSPLTDINIGFISQFPLDPMHLLHLGVMRKLLLYWVRNVEKKKVDSIRMSQKQSGCISERLLVLAENMPSEFNRKPRSLKEIDRWKAKEFRQFLLYLGPIVLKDILPECLYVHFLCLHIAASILSNTELSNQEVFLDFSEKMLLSFVEDMVTYYGKTSMVYNIHNLIHLVDDVRRFGNLNNFSCYEFENYLGHLKYMLRTKVKPLSQISRRFSEQINEIQPAQNTEMSFLHFVKRQTEAYFCQGEEYLDVLINNVRFSSLNGRDSCIFCKNKKIMLIKHILKQANNKCIFLCKEIVTDGFFYNSPCNSELTGLYNLDYVLDELISVQPKEIKSKCILNFKYKVLIVLVHELELDVLV